MPKVSVVMPTFNRADTIERAIKSVQAQNFQEWELIVVDDGSTDNTAELIKDMDPRLVLIRQANRGFTEARNVGVRAASGDFIAFIDSDDEMMPHHLELAVAFLEAHPDEHYLSTENIEDFGHGRRVNHFRIETSQWYPQKAAIVGSHRVDLPPGETDDYLRVYQTREPIGEWGRAIVERADPKNRTFLYRGNIFDCIRYDFLSSITATVFRKAVFAQIGLPDARWGTGSDFHFLATLARFAPTNFISIGTCIKHEYAANGELPAFGHVVTGKSAMRFVSDWQRAWDNLYWVEGTKDVELRGLRGLRQIWGAEAALRIGERALALKFLEQARKSLPHYWKAQWLYLLVRYLPSASISRRAYHAVLKVREPHPA